MWISSCLIICRCTKARASVTSCQDAVIEVLGPPVKTSVLNSVDLALDKDNDGFQDLYQLWFEKPSCCYMVQTWGGMEGQCAEFKPCSLLPLTIARDLMEATLMRGQTQHLRLTMLLMDLGKRLSCKYVQGWFTPT